MANLKYGDVCTGASAATVAWAPMGWKPVFFSEIEPFPCKLLKHYYPDVPNLGDMTKLSEHEEYNQSIIDVLVGGTPCQSFSLAGLREGLDSENGNLALEYCRILLRKQPKWFVWENVPGVFSSFTGETEDPEECEWYEDSDFASILNGFRECGYCCAYRVLDSQYFGVPHRRRRVFVVGYIGNDWRPPAAVFFEFESMYRDFTPIRKEAEEVTGDAGSSFEVYGIKSTAIGRKPENGGNGLGISKDIADTLTRVDRHGVCYRMVAFGEYVDDGSASTMKRRDYKDATDLIVTTYDGNQISSPVNKSNPKPNDPCHTLTKTSARNSILLDHNTYVVRRLTPLECERLQGFPDNYTKIKGASDKVRYEIMGNSMTTWVMAWIGNRINMVEDVLNELSENNIQQ